MIRAEIKIPLGFKTIIRQITIKNEAMKAKLSKLGDETAMKMKSVIQSKKVRPQAGEPTTLEDTIDVEHFNMPGIVAWGVGNIVKLNQEAPYWRVVNYGSNHLVGVWIQGHFEPGAPQPHRAHFREGRLKQGEPKYVFPVKNPIPAMNYIESTVNFLKQKLEGIISAFTIK